MIKIKSINHVCLWVRSLSVSKIYYEQLFAVKCFAREGDNKTLAVESPWVHFFISEIVATTDDPFIAKQHRSFAVDNLDDVIQHLKKRETINYKTGAVDFFQNRNYAWCEWLDPDGIRLECIEVK